MPSSDDRPLRPDLDGIRRQLARATPALLLAAAVPVVPDEDRLEWQQRREYGRRDAWARAIPSRFLAADLTSVMEPDAVGPLADWVTNRVPARNLILSGPVGSGKTFVAIAACRDAHFAGLEVAFHPVAEMFDRLRPGGDLQLLDVAMADVLILDDLGDEKRSDWTVEQLSILVNRRWLDERPTVATTNLTWPTLREHLEVRTFSRLVGDGAVGVELAGADRRGQKKGDSA